MDLYRLPEGYTDMKILGIPGIFQEALCLIEWPDRLSSGDTPDNYVVVDFRTNGNNAPVDDKQLQERRIRISLVGNRWEARAKDIIECLECNNSQVKS